MSMVKDYNRSGQNTRLKTQWKKKKKYNLSDNLMKLEKKKI